VLKDKKLPADEIDQHGGDGHAQLGHQSIETEDLDQPRTRQEASAEADDTDAKEAGDLDETVVAAGFENPKHVGDIRYRRAEENGDRIADGAIKCTGFIRETGINRWKKRDRKDDPDDLMSGKGPDTADSVFDELE